MPRKYSADFRSRAVALVRAGQTVTKAADDLGVTSSCLYGWVKQDRINRGEIPGVTTAVHGHGKVPIGGHVEVPAGGH